MNKQAFTTLLGVAMIGLIITSITTIAMSFIVKFPFWIFFFGLLFTVVAPLVILTIAWGQQDFEFEEGGEDFGAFKLFRRKKQDDYLLDGEIPIERMERV